MSPLLADYEALGCIAAAAVLGAYALLLLVLLAFKAFRNGVALAIGLVASGLASVPAGAALWELAQHPSFLKFRDVASAFKIMLVLLAAAWGAPILQYLIVSRRRHRGAGS